MDTASSDIELGLFDDGDMEMPGLENVSDEDSESESDDGWSASDSNDSEMFADDELTWSDDDEDDSAPRGAFWDCLRKWVRDEIAEMYDHRYEAPRDDLPRGPSYLLHVLTKLKNQRPDEFRAELRLNPSTFDDPIFTNNSNNAQLPVEIQVAIMLYRFGHDSNASGLRSTANWAGVAKGTVHLCTKRVMTAVLRLSFTQDAVCMPTVAEREAAKEWVEQHSCLAWRNGWCMVDGTTIPLTSKPTWYGESYFDRKARYSLNMQVSC